MDPSYYPFVYFVGGIVGFWISGAIFYAVQHGISRAYAYIRRLRADRKALRRSTLIADLKKLEVRRWSDSVDISDICYKCRDTFGGTDEIVILPCRHGYHTRCMDDRFRKVLLTCPYCNADMVPDPGRYVQGDLGIEEDAEAGEETPLLRPRRSVLEQLGVVSEEDRKRLAALAAQDYPTPFISTLTTRSEAGPSRSQYGSSYPGQSASTKTSPYQPSKSNTSSPITIGASSFCTRPLHPEDLAPDDRFTPPPPYGPAMPVSGGSIVTVEAEVNHPLAAFGEVASSLGPTMLLPPPPDVTENSTITLETSDEKRRNASAPQGPGGSKSMVKKSTRKST